MWSWRLSLLRPLLERPQPWILRVPLPRLHPRWQRPRLRQWRRHLRKPVRARVRVLPESEAHQTFTQRKMQERWAYINWNNNASNATYSHIKRQQSHIYFYDAMQDEKTNTSRLIVTTCLQKFISSEMVLFWAGEPHTQKRRRPLKFYIKKNLGLESISHPRPHNSIKWICIAHAKVDRLQFC